MIGSHGQGAAPACRIAVVIVSYEDDVWLDRCFASVGALLLAAAVIVVDNSASDRTRELAADYGCTYLRPGRNLGFAAGCNAGFRSAAALGVDYVCFMNADVIVRQDCLAELVGMADALDNVGALGPVQYEYDDESWTVTNAWHRKNARPSADYLAALIPRLGQASTPHSGVDGLTPVPYVQGSVLLCRRAAFQNIGGFDELYETFHEEVDLCRRLRLQGKMVAICDAAAARHAYRDISTPSWYRFTRRFRNKIAYVVADPSPDGRERLAVIARLVGREVVAVFQSPRPVLRSVALLHSLTWVARSWPDLVRRRRQSAAGEVPVGSLQA